jgi:undecaprenyl-diphosphatase
LAEFLPISSSGHLVVVPWLFGWDDLSRDPQLNRTFDVALHMGTFVGVVVYFWPDLRRYAAAGLRTVTRRRVEGADEQMAWLLALASVPAAVVGAAVDAAFNGEYGPEWLVGVMLIAFGAVLWWADRLPSPRAETGFGRRDALLMGTAQALALQPGVSRSGATISMGRWLGFDRETAARISFLMSIPIILGAGVFKGAQVLAGDGVPSAMLPAFGWGMLASAVTGFLAVWGLLRLVKRYSFAPFVAYRVVAGVAIIAVAVARAA